MSAVSAAVASVAAAAVAVLLRRAAAADRLPRCVWQDALMEWRRKCPPCRGGGVLRCI